MAQRFAKMHGLGNDFVIIDGVSAPPPRWGRSEIAALADRRRGVGFDQLLMLLPPPAEGDADFEYKIFNADGGEVGQCGNGARCAHDFAVRRGLAAKGRLVLQTISTRIVTESVAGGEVRASMPAPVFFPSVRAAGYGFYHLTVGNPHYVCLDGEVPAETARAVGEALNLEVAGGVNVGFGAVRDGEIALRVYERGAGLTDACGSGAVAAAAAAARAGLCGDEARVRMPGGEVLCGVCADGGVFLQGEVAHVFEGEVG